MNYMHKIKSHKDVLKINPLLKFLINVVSQYYRNMQNQQSGKAKHLTQSFLKLSEIYEDQISCGSQSSLAVHSSSSLQTKKLPRTKYSEQAQMMH